MPKMVNLTSFRKPQSGGQTVSPDRSFLIGQNLVENAKIKTFKYDFLGDFQTLCDGSKFKSRHSKFFLDSYVLLYVVHRQK